MKYCGMDLDRGQVFTLKGAVNDEQLGRLGYYVLPPHGMEKKECRYCDAVFVDLNTLNAHGAREHERQPLMPPLDPQQATETDAAYQNRVDAYNEELGRRMDLADEKVAKDDDRASPLFLDNTAASKGLQPPAEG